MNGSAGPIPNGTVFTRLTVLECIGTKNKRRLYRVLCSCGNEKSLIGSVLTTGNTRSCGCLQREQAVERATSHGMRAHPLYRIWDGMMQRCHNPKNPGYHRYGGRGIVVCERWHNPANFIADMSPRPGPQYEMDRRDNNGNYEPGNVEWDTKKVNMRNRRTTVFVEHEGEKRLLIELAEDRGFNLGTLRSRRRRGDAELLRPLRQGERHAIKESSKPSEKAP